MKTSIMNVLLTSGIALTTIGFAQSETSLAHTSPVAAPTYLGLGYSQDTLQVSTSSTDAIGLSPKVQTIAFKEGQLNTGFEALHADTTLSEVVAYYWETLSDLGFRGSVEALSGEAVRYSFSNGGTHLEAVFTQHSSDISADFSWAGVELVSTAY
jgi:hypothetical protein